MCEVVISGIGCNFSQSSNVEDFARHLLDNKHLVEDTTRWTNDVFTPVCGHVPSKHFDNNFFGVNSKLAKSTDPCTKLAYMRSFEALIDAGVHPGALRGSNTGVFACSGINEYEQKAVVELGAHMDGYVIMGLARTMLSNRISYYFDFKGPSFTIDSSWVGGHTSIQLAAASIRDGQADGVLVVASSVSLFGETSLLLNRLGITTSEGVTRSFDENGSGVVRSEGVVAMFLQRADLAKRCYARVLATGVSVVGPPSDLSPVLLSPVGMRDFLRELYRKHGIDPKKIAYLEADGNGNRLRDADELAAIDEALVQGTSRSAPLPIGSVKSNIGHVDCVNALAAMCKIVVALETGTIPATINYKQPNAKAAGLVEGRLQVVDTNTPLHLAADSVLAVNTVGLFSMIGHTVLAGNARGPARDQDRDASQNLPRLVTFSARTEEAAAAVANRIKNAPFDINFYRLLQDAFSDDIKGYNYRGYLVCPQPVGKAPSIAVLEKRPVWFVYSGMGSQWAGMGAGLMALPAFAETIGRLHAILEPHGVDLKTIVTETGPSAFDSIAKSFVGITACQIALTNVLTALGVVPDGIVGHSVGELCCGYADGCLTEEQTIMAAYSRGAASIASKLIKGKMAAIGLGYRDVLPILPPTIDVACHNSSTSCTLSGPSDDVTDFVQKLTDKGVFARVVNVSDIAYHSRYIREAGPVLLENLRQVIREPKPRSSKWITTSVPVDQRGTELDRYCSPEYQTNNLLSPVLLEEALEYIPADGVLIEIAPHGLLQAILKRAMPEAVHIALTQRANADPVRYLLDAVGRMSQCSIAPKVSALYPPVEFPVPRGTQSSAQMVLWTMDETTYNDVFYLMKEQEYPQVDFQNDSATVKIGESHIYPLSEQLSVLWKSAVLKDKRKQRNIVSIENVVVKQWAALPASGHLTLEAHCTPATSEAIVSYINDRGTACVSVNALIDTVVDEAPYALPVLEPLEGDAIELSKQELYRELSARGVVYGKKLMPIDSIRMGRRDWLISLSADCDTSDAIEALVQIFILRALLDGSQELLLPSRIRRLHIDLTKLKDRKDAPLRLHLATGVLQGPGLHMEGVTLQPPSFELHQPHDEHGRSPKLSIPSTDEMEIQYLGATPLGRRRYGEPCPLDYVGALRAGSGPRAARVMGVCRWQSDDRVPLLDEALRWPVPAAWSSRDAATVPFVYALVYHSLQVQAGAIRGESILVHEGTSAVGQAAIRVATGLGLTPVYTTVRSGRERDAVLAMFPQLEPAHVLTCGDGGSFEHRLRLLTRGQGVRLVVNTLSGAEFHASFRCTGYFGRLLNYCREDLTDTKIGTHRFLLATSVFGCSGDELFHTTDITRAQVVEAVAKGIRDGVVQPIVGAEVFSAGRNIAELVQGTKAVIEVGEDAPASSQQCDPHKCYVVVGSEAADALVLASRLAVLGARNILVAIGSAPTSPLVRQRQYALRQQLGVQLQVTQVRAWDAAAAAGVLKAAAAVAPVHSAIVVVKDEKEYAVAALVAAALQASQGLVLLSDRGDLAAPLTDLARKQQARGRHASCLGASICEATDLLGGLLRSSSVAVLASVSKNQVSDVDHDLSLSLTAPALAALSGARAQRSRRPRLVALASQVRDAHTARENRSLFVLPPLGVLDQDSKDQLGVLAARLFSPVLVVETAPGDSVRLAAQAVLRAVLERQPHGPYNVLGWRQSTVLALEVQRQLEAAGKCGVLFLVHGDVARVRQWAAHRRQGGGKDQVLDQVLEAVAAHEPDMDKPFTSRVHVIRTRDELQSAEWGATQSNIVLRTVADRSLHSEELAVYINKNAAWSQLAGEADLRLAIQLTATRI